MDPEYVGGYEFSSELLHIDTPFADNEDTTTFSFVRPVEEKEDQPALLNMIQCIDSRGSGRALHEDGDLFKTSLGSPPLPETADYTDQLPTDSVS